MLCDSGTLILLEKKLNINGKINDIYICSKCFVITNGSTFENIVLQEEGLDNFYRYSEDEIGKIDYYVGCNKNILQSVLPFFMDRHGVASLHDKTLLEIGCGRGFLLIAASQLGFKKAIGIDLNMNTFNETKRHIEIKDNVAVVTDIKDAKDQVDCVVMWHTLEHIYDPNFFFRNLRPKLNNGCIFFIQVPQYYQPYICDTHYYFYTDPSMRTLFQINGCETLQIGYDPTYQFMTAIGRFTG